MNEKISKFTKGQQDFFTEPGLYARKLIKQKRCLQKKLKKQRKKKKADFQNLI
jgi:hypothetical protein